MESMCAYAGKILFIDLSNRNWFTRPMEDKEVELFIGGTGLNTKLLYDLVKPHTDPFSDKNPLIFGGGPLVGTLAPGASRVEVAGLSPLTGYLGTANGGHSIGNSLKYAGYDHLVISGRTDRPVYLKITDDNIQFCDASHLWGKDTWETTKTLNKELGPAYDVCCIGPGGENKVRYAVIVNNGHSVFSRTGMGAIMGSKSLKAIAVKGTRLLHVADRKGFLNLVNKIKGDLLSKPPVIQGWRTLGFLQGLTLYSKMGFSSKRNMQETFETMADCYPPDQYLSQFRGGNFACMACPIGCKGWIRIENGDYRGLSMRVSSPGTQALILGIFGVDRFDEVFKCTELANKYGLDTVSLVGSVSLAMEMFEKGLLTTKDTDGMDLRWDAETLRKWIPKVATREGLGDLLAEGVMRMSERLGRGTEDFAIHVKGLEMGLDVRGRLCVENFGQATNVRGAHVERSASITFSPGRSKESIMRYSKGIGAPEDKLDLLSSGAENFNVPRLTKWVEDFNTMMFCVGLCHRTPLAQAYNLKVFSEIFAAATGIDLSAEKLRECGERVWNLQKSFNVREGASRKDDLFSPRILNEPITLSGNKRGPITKETVNVLLDEYYDEREWNVERGVPTREKLTKLGLESVANELSSLALID